MDKTHKILVVDDDREIREVIRVLLESEGYSIVEAADGSEALDKFNPDIDLVILDIIMEGLSGYQVCQMIREKSNVPIMFLTAKGKESDLTLGFSYGGDDYIAKPFSYVELVARIKGLLRRYDMYKVNLCGQMEDNVIEWHGISLHLNKNDVRKNGEHITLTHKEYLMLRLMMMNRGEFFSAQKLYENIWEEPFYQTSNNTVMVHVRRLREKIEDDPDKPEILRTVWGKGYHIE